MGLCQTGDPLFHDPVEASDGSPFDEDLVAFLPSQCEKRRSGRAENLDTVLVQRLISEEFSEVCRGLLDLLKGIGRENQVDQTAKRRIIQGLPEQDLLIKE